ncbi:unnamed protein product, partial [Mesorhabditis belari]|uniref:G protein-coupled receptor n=1 Tax=Mesorhabditis belari TaxID=2138241 RepID=A0AAF3J807_9BILA
MDSISAPRTILTILGVAANIFLLFVLLTERRIRSKYANFLTIIAAYNIFFTLTIHGIVKNSVHSAATKNVHMQLIQILITQLLSTLFTEVLPFTLCTVGGFIGLEAFTPYTIAVTSAYPTLDVFIILILVKAFRKRTSDILRKLSRKGIR